MSQQPSPSGVMMPKVVDLFLTNKVPCAVLAVVMLSSVYWIDMLFGSLGVLALILVVFGVLLHLVVPGLFALVTLGGGLKYSLQTGAIAAILLLLFTSGSIGTAVVFFLLFVVLPSFSARLLQQQGMGQAAWLLALVLCSGVGFAMVAGAGGQSVESLVQQQFQPVFDEMLASIPPGATAEVASVQHLQAVMVKVFPGFFILSLCLIWWSDVLLARKLAIHYGFYQGNTDGVLAFALPKVLVYVLLILLPFANMAEGNVQYLALGAAIVLAGLLAVQGVMVAHAWLKNRNMVNTIVVMYVLLFFWFGVVVMFALIGLLDVWFNFRRNFGSATGEK